MSPTNRRNILISTGVLAGAGLVGLHERHDAAPAFEDAAIPTTAGRSALPQSVRGVSVRVARASTAPGQPFDIHGPALPYGDLTTAQGRHLGRFDTSHLDGGRRPQHLQTLTFDGGSVVGLGPAQTEGTFTIVGASGRYAAATGTYTVAWVDGDSLGFHFSDQTEV